MVIMPKPEYGYLRELPERLAASGGNGLCRRNHTGTPVTVKTGSNVPSQDIEKKKVFLF
jgi:hypothetical protein